MSDHGTKRPSAPNYHIASARKGREAGPIIAREGRALLAGALIGLLAAGTLFCLALWLWAVPTADAALAMAQAAAL